MEDSPFRSRRGPSATAVSSAHFSLFHGGSEDTAHRRKRIIIQANPVLSLNPLYVKVFDSELEDIQFINAKTFAYILPDKIYISSLHYSLGVSRNINIC